MTVKNNIFEPLKLQVSNAKEIFITYKRELTVRMIEAILYCVEFKISKLTFAEIETEGTKGALSLNVHESDFSQNIDINFNRLIGWEEYELCSACVKAKEIISSRPPVKPPKKKEIPNNLIETLKNL